MIVGVTRTQLKQQTRATRGPANKRTEVAFLLAQLGTYAADQFKERATAHGFTRPQAGLLRLIAHQPGQSQQAFATALGTPPSRLVALADDLEHRGLIQRRRNPDDRRNYAVYLTDAGRAAMTELRAASAEHETAITTPLDKTERDELHRLLTKLADAHGLHPGIHPGYQKLGPTSQQR